MQFDQLKRRDFITLLGGAAAMPLAARAQQQSAQLPTKTARIGVLSLAAGPNPIFMDLFRGLREFGWVDGKNMAVEYRWASGRQDRLSALAADLVRLKVDVIVTASTPAALAAKQATTTIPIVVTFVADPVGSGIVTSLARPGGNITGVTDNTADLIGKFGAAHANGFAGRPDSGPLGSGRTPGTYQPKYARGARSRRASAWSAAGIHGYTAVR